MSTKAEVLAKQFEDKARQGAAMLATLTDADWKRATEAEKWPVGVTAHHLAGAYEPVAAIVTAVAFGRPLGPFSGLSMTMIDQMNAAHAREHGSCTRAETIALFEKNAAAAVGAVRALSDDQLAKSGTVFTDSPPMTVEQLIAMGLIGHTDEHLASIRKAVGR
jgi:hypothetical protein